jgi:hypothetical protein
VQRIALLAIVGGLQFRSAGLAAMACVLASCATPYTPSGLLGGFNVKELREDVYRVTFVGNGYTTAETAQTYWLFQCAELTDSKGYYGFEILSDMKFAQRSLPDDGAGQSLMRRNVAAASPIRIPLASEELPAATNLLSEKSEARSTAARRSDYVRVARFAAPMFVYVPSSAPPRQVFEGDIHLLKKPFEAAPPKMFVAAALKAALDGHVKSEKCGLGNVCPHVHEYLLPKGKLRPQ